MYVKFNSAYTHVVYIRICICYMSHEIVVYTTTRDDFTGARAVALSPDRCVVQVYVYIYDIGSNYTK